MKTQVLSKRIVSSRGLLEGVPAMSHAWRLPLRQVTMLLVAMVIIAGSVSLPVATAQAGMQATKNIREEIQRNGGKLPRARVRALSRALYRGERVTRPGNRIARRASAGNTVEQVGDQPEGFGQQFNWDRKDDEILLAMFVNAADYIGANIAGVQQGDEIQIVRAEGIASFAEDTGNPTATSIIGLVGVGANVALGLAGFPEAAPLVNAASSFAQDQFKASNVKHKRRDAFGEDPSTHHRARQEGGIIVSLPEAGGGYYSGIDEVYWIKKHEPRLDPIRPNHVKAGFFLVRSDSPGGPANNARKLRSGGILGVQPWDHLFEDNAGYYKVFLRIKKGSTQPPGILNRRRN
jgi:hypothetical protein